MRVRSVVDAWETDCRPVVEAWNTGDRPMAAASQTRVKLLRFVGRRITGLFHADEIAYIAAS